MVDFEAKYVRILSGLNIPSNSTTESVSAKQHIKYDIEPRIIILSGISGVGKTTVGKHLETKGYKKLRTVYTRARRKDETDSDGIFASSNEFDRLEKAGKFVLTTSTNNSRHGVLLSEISMVKKLWTDRSVSAVKKLMTAGVIQPEATKLIYLLPPSFSTLMHRLHLREDTESYTAKLKESAINDRIAEELGEMEKSSELPYHYVINDKIENVVKQILPLMFYTQ